MTSPGPDLGQYRIGWICAIQTEYTVACALLDHEYHTPAIPPHDDNVYTCGRIGGHDVVIACLPKGKYGLTSAGNVGRDMLRTFHSINVGLMVGIAGGAPAQKDIRLGDVVVGCPTGTSSGVIHYQSGKNVQGEKLRLTGFLNPPPRQLLAAMNKLSAIQEREGHKINQTISQLLDRKPRLKAKYQSPGESNDRLYIPTFIHKNEHVDCEQCCPRHGSKLVSRSVRKKDEDNPQIHYGIIASSDLLMKDAVARDTFSKDQNLLCFEMEAAGLMDHFPCLVIRGICDYSDTHKNDLWQGYAAATAAAYAKELLQILPTMQPTQQPSLPQNIRSSKTGLSRLAGPPSQRGNVSVIAIHGLGGDAYSTWTDKNRRLWLRDSLPRFADQACIYTYGYNSTLAFNGSFACLRSAASSLLVDLTHTLPAETGPDGKLLFICHGLGGILLKEALDQARKHPSTKNLSDSIIGTICLGAPQQSLTTIEWTSLLSRMINSYPTMNVDRSQHIDNLGRLAQTLADVSKEQYAFVYGFPIVSFYEEVVPGNGDDVVVPKSAAIAGTSRERIIALSTDHWSMASLSTTTTDPPSTKVQNEIAALVAESLSANNHEQLHTTLLEKFYCFDYEMVFTRIPAAVPGTGWWFTCTRSYFKWEKSARACILYLRGPPGYGKSVLAAKMIHDFRNNPGLESSAFERSGNTVVHYFFGKAAGESNSQVFFLRSILHQLLQHHPSLATPIQYSLENSSQPSERTTLKPYLQKDALWKVLETALAVESNRTIIFVIDALDEAYNTEVEDIASRLMSLVHSLHGGLLGGHVKILLTSRHNEHIGRQLWNYNAVAWDEGVFTVDMQENEMSEDVQKFLEVAVTKYGQENAFPPTSVKSIIDAIVARANGMFLWAHLAWEDFKKDVVIWSSRIIGERLNRLQNLPPGIESLYERLIKKIDRAAWKELELLMANLLVAPHKVTCHEVGQMLAIHGDETKTGDIDAPFSVEQIIAIHCPTLLVVYSSGIIDFVHLSLKEFLLKSQKQNIQRLHYKLAEMCVHYLTLEDIQAAAMKDVKQWKRSRCSLDESQFHFYNYAAKCIDHHMRHVPFDDDLWLRYANMTKNYEAYHGVRGVSHTWHARPRKWHTQAPDFCVPTPLSSALELGGYALIGKFAEIGYDLQERWCERLTIGGSITILATSAMHKYVAQPSVIQKLLQHGMSPNIRDHNGRTALHLAAIGSRTATVRMLLDSDRTEVNLQDSEGKTALHYEAAISSSSIISSDKRVDLKIKDNYRRTAITFAASWGNSAMVAEMTRTANSSTWSHKKGDLSPLIAAALLDWEELTNTMLNKVSDLNLHRSHDGRSILHVAIRNDWIDTVKKAVELGADVNAVDNNGRTPLHYAAELGSYQIARLLIRLGATARIQDRLGRTAVHTAAVEGFADTMLPLMLTSDYDINAVDGQRRGVVHWAASCDYDRIMRLVLESPDVNLLARDSCGRTALHVAAACGCPNVVRVLLDSGYYDITDVDAFGNTLLHLAARSGSLSVFRLLGPRLDLHKHRINKWGQTALDTAHIYGCMKSVLTLLEISGIRQQKKYDPQLTSNRPLYGGDAKWFDLISGDWNRMVRRVEKKHDRDEKPNGHEDKEHAENKNYDSDGTSTSEWPNSDFTKSESEKHMRTDPR